MVPLYFYPFIMSSFLNIFIWVLFELFDSPFTASSRNSLPVYPSSSSTNLSVFNVTSTQFFFFLIINNNIVL